jgi:hypothetical protein
MIDTIALLAHAGHGEGVAHSLYHVLTDPLALTVAAGVLALAAGRRLYRRSRRSRR